MLFRAASAKKGGVEIRNKGEGSEREREKANVFLQSMAPDVSTLLASTLRFDLERPSTLISCADRK